LRERGQVIHWSTVCGQRKIGAGGDHYFICINYGRRSSLFLKAQRKRKSSYRKGDSFFTGCKSQTGGKGITRKFSPSWTTEKKT